MNKTSLEFTADIFIDDFYIDFINSTNEKEETISWDDFHKKLNLDKLVEKFKVLIDEEYQLIYKSYISKKE